MAITSEKNEGRFRRYGNTQFRYAMTYVAITLLVLLFLNFYTTRTSQELFFNSKQTAMIERCKLAATEFSTLEVFSPATVSSAVEQLGSLRVSRLLVTDQSGMVIYDSLAGDSALGKTALLPEIVTALRGNDVFSGQYRSGAMHSQAATPIYSYGSLLGAVYMSEFDASQGAIVQTLQKNVFTTTLALEVVLVIFSLIFASIFSHRLKKIMDSMATIQKGDYTHRVEIGGSDELAVLGREFNDLTDRLRTSEQKRQQFVSDASHELKTPLASIKLLSDSILQNEMDMETVREFVSDIGNEADRLNRMSQKLLTLTRADNTEEDPREILDIGPTVERVVRMLEMIAAENRITVSCQVEADCPILILEDDLYQITFNLVENGIKYNNPGGLLTVKVFRQEDNGVLEVTDTGVGISEEAAKHVFERFYRVDKARSRKTGGSGLGLAIVRNLVQRNGGEIGVESVLGQGSTFRVSFPIFDTEEERQ